MRQVTTRLVSQVWAIGASLAQFPLPVFTHLVEDLLGTGPGLPVVPAGEGRLGQVGQHLQVVRAHLVGWVGGDSSTVRRWSLVKVSVIEL